MKASKPENVCQHVINRLDLESLGSRPALYICPKTSFPGAVSWAMVLQFQLADTTFLGLDRLFHSFQYSLYDIDNLILPLGLKPTAGVPSFLERRDDEQLY